MKLRFLVTIAAMCIATLANAGEKPAGPDARKLLLARQLIDTIHLTRDFDEVMQRKIPSLIDQTFQAKSDLTPEQRQAIKEAALEASHSMMLRIVDKAVPIYAEVYSEQELMDLIAFYGSPVGQATLAKSPEIALRMVPIFEQAKPELATEILVRTCLKMNCTRPPSTPSKSS
jgi:uncharacterized protein